MAIVLIQQNTGTNSAGVPTSLLSGVASGNFLIAVCANSSGSTNAFTVTDSLGNTWALATSGFLTGAANTRIEIWYSMNVAAGATTITATSLGTSSGIVVQEYSGVVTSSALDVAAGGGNATATTFGSTGQATIDANDLLIVGINYNTVSGTNTATDNNVGGIWSLLAASLSSMIARLNYAIVSSTGTYSNNVTVGTTEPSGWTFASFKAAVIVSSDAVSAISKERGF